MKFGNPLFEPRDRRMLSVFRQMPSHSRLRPKPSCFSDAGSLISGTSPRGSPAATASIEAPHRPYFHPHNGYTASRRTDVRVWRPAEVRIEPGTARRRRSTSTNVRRTRPRGIGARPAELQHISTDSEESASRRMLARRSVRREEATGRALTKRTSPYAVRKTSCSLKSSVASRSVPRRARQPADEPSIAGRN
jgi:hypothetical protein